MVIQTLLGTVASDVSISHFAALQFLDNHFSGAVVGKLLVWAGTFRGEFSFIVFMMLFMVFFPSGCLFVPHAGFGVFDNT